MKTIKRIKNIQEDYFKRFGKADIVFAPEVLGLGVFTPKFRRKIKRFNITL